MKNEIKKLKIIPASEVFAQENLTPQELLMVEDLRKYYRTLWGLRKTRIKLGITQKELARRTKIPQATISKIESGNRNVTIDKIMTMAEAMGKSVEIRLR